VIFNLKIHMDHYKLTLGATNKIKELYNRYVPHRLSYQQVSNKINFSYEAVTA
jgi:hypothetical protein